MSRGTHDLADTALETIAAALAELNRQTQDLADQYATFSALTVETVNLREAS